MVRIGSCWAFFGAVLLLAGAWSARADEEVDAAVQTVYRSRQELVRIMDYVVRHPELFPTERQAGKRLLTRQQKMQSWRAWQQMLDQISSLDRVGRRAAQAYYREKGDARKAPFRIAFAAFLAQYRFALDFIAYSENAGELHTVLNEPMVELGLPGGSYAAFKFRFLNLILGAEFARLSWINRYFGEDPDLILTKGMAADQAVIWAAGKKHGPLETARNGLQIVRDKAFDIWFPVQKGVSNWMGDTKVWRRDQSLIAGVQVVDAQKKLTPGDILLVRREWYLSNIGLPGFWPHAALYIGTPEERRAVFDIPAVQAWVKEQDETCSSLEDLLKKRYPEAYRRSLEPDPDASPPRVIEAISEGVSFTSLQHCLHADSAAVLRPQLPPEVKARALVRAFHYSGRPYDFNFDFLTDSSLVCTELVYKAYESDDELGGLLLPTLELLGRPVLPANEIARRFVEERRSEQPQFVFILFLDGLERDGVAVEKDVDAFSRSVNRPKWHIWMQKDLKPE